MRLPKRLLLTAAAGAIAARRVLRPPYDFTGKKVIVTGGSRGLGLALAREFLERGASVMLAARHPGELARAKIMLGGERVQTYAGDLTSAQHIQGVLDNTVRVFGGLDVLVNNAGIIQTGPLGDMTEADFREIMEINAFTPLRLTLAARPHLKRSGGRVLIVSSVGGKVAVPHLTPYSVSKFASAGLGQAFRAELAREGISVTTALPALMRTGSARQAQVKGQQEKEYALFATLDNAPVISLDARTAARRMVNALGRGQGEVMVTGPAYLLRYAQAFAPELVADVMALTNRLLPAPTGRTDAVRGQDAESKLTRQNPIKREAEREFNQLGPGGTA